MSKRKSRARCAIKKNDCVHASICKRNKLVHFTKAEIEWAMNGGLPIPLEMIRDDLYDSDWNKYDRI